MWTLAVGVALFAACSANGPTDAGLDAAGDAPVDTGLEASLDASRPDGGPLCPFDASSVPTRGPGQCTAVVNAGATSPVGDDGVGGFITPDGRRVSRVGTRVVLHGFPMRVVQIPGTRYVVVMDAGLEDEHLFVVDVDTHAVVDDEPFANDGDHALFLGLAVSSDATKLWASGGGSNHVWAFDVDATTGHLTAAHARDLVVTGAVTDGYVAGLALLPSGDVAVNLLFASSVVVFDHTTGLERGRVGFPPPSYPYDLRLSPDGATLWASLMSTNSVVPIDVATLVAGAAIPVPKGPEGLAVSPDGTTVAVASSDDDTVTLIDTVTRTATTTLPIDAASALHGHSPASVAFAADGTLYVVAAADNAVQIFAPGTHAFAGRVPTKWYPTDVLPLADGTLLVTNGKDEGTGPNTDPAARSITELLFGSLEIVDPTDLTPTQLATWDAEITANDARPETFNTVSCPSGAPYDFPIPQPGSGPSAVIEHVIVVVRENKTYDDYLGDLRDSHGAPYGNGDPSLVLIPGMMDRLVPNTRELARQFAHADNYYSDAEQSIQGHVWTTNGRTTDFTERTWLTSWGRGYWAPPPQFTIYPLGYSEEGSVFDWVSTSGLSGENDGEIVASHSLSINARYPGLIFILTTKDQQRAQYLERHWLFDCDLPSFTYVLLPDDHTQGGQAGQPTPESMIADNDEGVGILADALSRSQYWSSSLLVFIEDDPQDGGDHVDNHRSLAVFVSPWVKRGYVTHVHYNEASIYRTLQLILGVSEPLNSSWEHAAPLFDLFTSDPDYTPYVRIPRAWPEDLNPAGTPAAALAAHWDFSRPDNQPGLSQFLWSRFHPTLPAPPDGD